MRWIRLRVFRKREGCLSSGICGYIWGGCIKRVEDKRVGSSGLEVLHCSPVGV